MAQRLCLIGLGHNSNSGMKVIVDDRLAEGNTGPIGSVAMDSS
jgi:hypothetical protein